MGRKGRVQAGGKEAPCQDGQVQEGTRAIAEGLVRAHVPAERGNGQALAAVQPAGEQGQGGSGDVDGRCLAG